MHKGVGVVIGNRTRTKFFIQQKDETYPIEKWRNSFSFWGGKIETGDDSILDALKREISEEITNSFNFNQANFSFIKEFRINSDSNFIFYFFELLLDEKEFNSLRNATILEGKSSFKTGKELLEGNWIWSLETVIYEYFNSIT